MKAKAFLKLQISPLPKILVVSDIASSCTVQGENRLGRVGYLIGTQVGSWAGSRIALMSYDIAKAIQLITLEVKDFITGADENEKVGELDTSLSEEEYIISDNSYDHSSSEDEIPSSDGNGSGCQPDCPGD